MSLGDYSQPLISSSLAQPFSSSSHVHLTNWIRQTSFRGSPGVHCGAPGRLCDAAAVGPVVVVDGEQEVHGDELIKELSLLFKRKRRKFLGSQFWTSL